MPVYPSFDEIEKVRKWEVWLKEIACTHPTFIFDMGGRQCEECGHEVHFLSQVQIDEIVNQKMREKNE